MIAFIDLEHPRVAASPSANGSMALRLKIQYRLEDISSEPCIVIRYKHVTPAHLRKLGIKAVLVSGCATEFDQYDETELAGLYAVMRSGEWPVIGFCGGAQRMAEVHGSPVAAIGPLPPDEVDPTPQQRFVPGMKQERGFMPVQVVAPHPLFAGLSDPPVFFESHYWEIKTVPPGFKNYATTDTCAIQMIEHESLPLMAVQFHAEQYNDENLDGRRFLANWFRYVGVK